MAERQCNVGTGGQTRGTRAGGESEECTRPRNRNKPTNGMSGFVVSLLLGFLLYCYLLHFGASEKNSSLLEILKYFICFCVSCVFSSVLLLFVFFSCAVLPFISLYGWLVGWVYNVVEC